MSDVERLAIAARTLIVDDDPVARVMAGRCLAQMGFEVSEARNGWEALTSAEQKQPDLVVLDVEMPGLDGFDTCKELRKRYSSRELSILIVTGHTDQKNIDRAFEAGATDYVSKPIDWRLLQHRVRFLMRAHHAMMNLRAALGRLQKSQDGLDRAQRLARLGSWEWMPGESEMVWSQQIFRILGFDPKRTIPTIEAFTAAIHVEDRPSVEEALHCVATEAQASSLDHRLVNTAGEELFVHQQMAVQIGNAGAPERISGTLQDITELRRAEDRVRFLSHYDPLTALPNRRLLSEHLRRILGHAHTRSERVALIHIDVDRFKRVNDSLGHAAGDEMLKVVAERLTSCVRTTDFVGRNSTEGPLLSRLAGDEFMVILRGVESDEDAATAARRILDLLREPFPTEQGPLKLSASIGIAIFPGDGTETELLLQRANAAIDQAKAQGGGIYQFFEQSMNERVRRSLVVENELRVALERGEIEVAYQPLLEIATGRITAVEALARWCSPKLGQVSPVEFIHAAEESGSIGALGEQVLRAVCAQQRAWSRAGAPSLRVAVNVSSRQLADHSFVGLVERVLAEERTAPEFLEFEITESSLIADEPVVAETLQRIRALGISLSIDDFGTGYSSLGRLVSLPFDVLKIDRCFVAEIGSSSQSETIISAIVAMGHQLGLQIVAEGIETVEQAAKLEELGCDLLQGYWIARPMAAAALSGFLDERG